MLYARLWKRRGLVLALFAMLMAACALFTARIAPDSSIAAFFPDSDSRSVRLSRLLTHSPLAGLVFVDIEAEDRQSLHETAERLTRALPAHVAKPLSFAPKDLTPEAVLAFLPPFFDAAMERRLSDLDEDAMAARLREDKALLGSLASSFAIPWVQKDPLQLRLLLKERLPRDVSGLSLAAPYPVSEDGRHALLLLRPAGQRFSASSASELQGALSALEKELPQGTALRMSGGPLYTAANASTIENDISRIVSLSLAGLAAVYLVMLRSLAALWLVLIPASATLAACGLTSLFWPSVSALALGFGASLMGLAEDYAAHMLFGLRSGGDPAKAHGLLTKPLVVSCLLNLSGFFLLLFSGIPAVRQLALFSILSLGAGCLMAILVLPLLPRGAEARKNMDAAALRAPRLPSPRRVTACVLLLGLALAALAPQAELDLSPRSLGAQSQELADAAEQMRSRWSLAAGTSLAVQGRSAAESLELARRASAALRSAGLELTSPSDFLPSADEQAASLARWKAWQEAAGPAFLARLDSAAAQTGFSQKAFAPFRQILLAPGQPVSPETLRALAGDMADLFFFQTGQEHCTVLSLKDAPGLPALEAMLGPELAGHCFLLDPALMEQAVTDLFHEEKTLIGLTVLFCFAALCLSQRSAIRTMVMAVSPLASFLAVLALFLLLGERFTLTACVAVPIVLGLAIDHGIMVTHALESGQELGIRRAVTLSTLTALFSMGLLAFAEHPALRSMGLVIFTGLAAELFSALFLLPLLCKEEKA